MFAKRKDIIITTADKGGTVVIMDVEKYINEATYQKILKIAPPRLAKNAFVRVTLNYFSLQKFVNILMK